ncbi:hypothetical protein V8E36_006663 [Tilletia maclaganii]
MSGHVAVCPPSPVRARHRPNRAGTSGAHCMLSTAPAARAKDRCFCAPPREAWESVPSRTRRRDTQDRCVYPYGRCPCVRPAEETSGDPSSRNDNNEAHGRCDLRQHHRPQTADDLPRIVHLACTRLERSITASVADLESFHIWTSFSSVSDPEASELTMPNPELWTSMTDALDKDRPPRRRVEASESMYAWRSPPTPGTRTHPASKHMVFGNSEGEDPTATPKAGLEPHRLQLSLKMIHADECHSRWPSSPGHSKSVNCPEHGVTRA